MRRSFVPAFGAILAALVAACGGTTPPPAAPKAEPAPAPAAPSSAAPAPAPATPSAPMTAEKALERVFRADTLQSDWFAKSMLDRVPLEQIATLQKQMRAKVGDLREVHKEGDAYLLQFERGTQIALVHLDDAGRIDGLLVRPKPTTVAESVEELKHLPGTVSVLVVTDGKDVSAVDATRPMAVGSAYKLATVAAVRADVDKKKRRWSDVVDLRDANRSAPSGILQGWPDKTPVTLATLATLAISISDNTANDTLLRVVGREAVEALAPRNKPLLSTRELFQLKSPEHAADLARYEKADEAGRRAILKELDAAPLTVDMQKPTALDVEWFFTAREMCALMAKLDDMPMMSINPGVANRADWDRIAFKGGSEPGVLSATTTLKKGDHTHCVTATWNSLDGVDERAFFGFYSAVIEALKAKPADSK